MLATPVTADPGPAVSETEIMVGDSLTGAFFATPEGEGPFPTIILLGGSEGGDCGSRGSAKRFLAEGYAVLGLPTVSLVFTDAGHFLSGDGSPREGAREADIAAQQVIWPATLRFFEEHLKD